MPAEGLRCSDTSGRQPRSRVAGGSFGPGDRNGAAVAQSSESDLHATMRMCSSSRKRARCIRNPTSASWWICPTATLPFLCSLESQASVVLEPLELLTQTVEERLWCPCSCLLFGQCFLELLFVCYRVEIVFLRCCALLSTEVLY